MRKTIHILGLAVVSMLVSCNGGKTDSPVTDSTLTNSLPATTDDGCLITEEAANTAIEKIYTEVMRHYNDGTFASASYTEFESERFAEMCRRSGESEFICIDWDYWIRAQDFDNVKLSRTAITGFDMEKRTAKADVYIINFNKEQLIQPSLIFENGKWVIDDFTEDGNSLYSIMKDCVTQSGK